MSEVKPIAWFIIFAKPDEDISEAIAYKSPQHGAIKGLATKYIEASTFDKLAAELEAAKAENSKLKEVIELWTQRNASLQAEIARLSNLMVVEVNSATEHLNAERDRLTQSNKILRDGLDIKTLADKFLVWSLPKTVRPDPCVLDKNYPYPMSGTNLLTADEAFQMFEALLGDVITAADALKGDVK